MSIESWAVIAAIATPIVTLVGPIIAVLFQYRMSQPKPNPDANQPKNRIQSIGGRTHKLLMNGLQGLSVLLAVGMLILGYFVPPQLERLATLMIVVGVVVIAWNSLFFFIRMLLNTVDLQIASDIAGLQLMLALIEYLQKTLSKTPDKPPLGTLDKLQDALKRLLRI